MKRMTRSGQSALEAVMTLSFVGAALIFMGFYAQRGAQGGVKGSADGLGSQFSTQSNWNTFASRRGHEENLVSSDASCSTYQHGVGEDADFDGLPDNAPVTAQQDCVPGNPRAGWTDPGANVP